MAPNEIHHNYILDNDGVLSYFWGELVRFSGFGSLGSID